MLKSLPKILTISFLIIFIFQLVCLVFLFAIPQVSQAADETGCCITSTEVNTASNCVKNSTKDACGGVFSTKGFISGDPNCTGSQGLKYCGTSNATADSTAATSVNGEKIPFTPQIKIGDYTFQSGDTTTGNIANYVRAIYKYAIGIVGILAAVVLMIGGVMWIVAGGSSTMIGEAKAWIGASLTGLLLALMSYLILATVNPALVDLKTSAVGTVANVATPTATTVANGCCVNTSNPPASICKATEQSACPTIGTQAWYQYICSSDTMKNTCQPTASDCVGQPNGTVCTPASPVSGAIYECSSSVCNPCQKQSLNCSSTVKCCDSLGLKCQGICILK